ncbi:MAG: cysteine desulfurase [Clostridiales bacterium]|jgi:cysteine desulfurase|nr:cysteine desulfurase [Clostridiales bacterium]
MIYLDYAADTPADEEVLKVFTEMQREYFANPNSTHPLGLSAAKKLREALDGIKGFFDGIETHEFISLSSASEANNLAIKGIAETYRERGRHIVSTVLEHPSVGGALTYLQSKGWEVELVSVGRDGKIDLEHLRSLMRKDTVLVTVAAVDSELGTVQPIERIAEIVAEYPACRFHTDATQAVGRIPFSLSGVHAASFAAHKLYGLNGSGFLIRHNRTVLTPLIHGGNSLSPYRSGTPSLPLIASAYKALELMFGGIETRFKAVSALNRTLRDRLKTVGGILINSPTDASPYILNFSAVGIKAEVLKDALGERGVAASVKSACSVKNTPSKAVYAVTGDKKRALSSVRFSLSHLTTEEEAVTAVEILRECVLKLKI